MHQKTGHKKDILQVSLVFDWLDQPLQVTCLQKTEEDWFLEKMPCEVRVMEKYHLRKKQAPSLEHMIMINNILLYIQPI